MRANTPAEILALPFSALSSVDRNNWVDDVSQIDDNHNENINEDNLVKADQKDKKNVKDDKSAVEREKCDQSFWQSGASGHLFTLRQQSQNRYVDCLST